jgi:hypothetical protein
MSMGRPPDLRVMERLVDVIDERHSYIRGGIGRYIEPPRREGGEILLLIFETLTAQVFECRHDGAECTAVADST